jgi:hypothetical protein
MSDTYSVLLIFSIAAVVASWLGIGAAKWWHRVPEWLHRLIFLLLLLALALDALSLTVHVTWGHRPGTDQAMNWRNFLTNHPAFLVVAFFSLLAWVLRPRQR